MKITICGSVAFIKEMERAARDLAALGHEAKFPPLTEPGEDGTPIPVLEYYRFKKESAHNKSHWIWKNHDRPH